MRRIMLAKNQNSTVRKLTANKPSGLQTIDIWHADVHQDNVRQQLFGLFDGVNTIDRLSTYFQLGT